MLNSSGSEKSQDFVAIPVMSDSFMFLNGWSNNSSGENTNFVRKPLIAELFLVFVISTSCLDACGFLRTSSASKSFERGEKLKDFVARSSKSETSLFSKKRSKISGEEKVNFSICGEGSRCSAGSLREEDDVLRIEVISFSGGISTCRASPFGSMTTEHSCSEVDEHLVVFIDSSCLFFCFLRAVDVNSAESLVEKGLDVELSACRMTRSSLRFL